MNKKKYHLFISKTATGKKPKKKTQTPQDVLLQEINKQFGQ